MDSASVDPLPAPKMTMPVRDVEDPEGQGTELCYEGSAKQSSSTDGSESDDELPHLTEEGSMGFDTKPLHLLKYFFSFALLAFSSVMISAAIFTRQTTATGEAGLHPVIAFVVFWAMLLWLAQMEGGLNVMVGLKPVNKDLYDQSHPLAHHCTAMAHKGDNLERFIVGRQYLDLSMVFLTNFMVTTLDGTSVLGLPGSVSRAFFETGLAVTLITIIVGQLVAQINSAHHMLDFINNYVMWATTFMALLVEGSGLLHAVYLVQMIVATAAGKKIESVEPWSCLKRTLFWLRVFLSTCLLLLAVAVTFKALFDGQTTMWEGVPAYASVGLLVALILIGGIMEGLQIAFMAVKHIPQEELKEHPVAQRNCELAFDGKNLEAFLVGRQICQTVIMFLIARITTVDVDDDEENIFGVSDSLQRFINTGVPGALISTIIASLSWRIMGSTFPVVFLANPLANPIIHLCLWVEATGICSIAWVIAAGHRVLAGLKPDKDHIQRAQEIAKHTEQIAKQHDLSVDQTDEGSY